MPIHDWTRVNAGLFHHFHHRWISAIGDALGAGLLPEGYFALAEQTIGGLVPDVLTLQRPDMAAERVERMTPGGVAVAEAPPRVRFVSRTDEEVYAAKASRIVVRHVLGQVIAVLEIVSPGNKSGKAALKKFVEKAVGLLDQGIHLLVVDLFPPTPRDPQGIHKAIWDEVRDAPFELPSDKPLTVVSYVAGPAKTAYIEPVAVGDALPSMPIFLDPDWYVAVPLEETYQTTWSQCPRPMREAVVT